MFHHLLALSFTKMLIVSLIIGYAKNYFVFLFSIFKIIYIVDGLNNEGAKEVLT